MSRYSMLSSRDRVDLPGFPHQSEKPILVYWWSSSRIPSPFLESLEIRARSSRAVLASLVDSDWSGRAMDCHSSPPWTTLTAYDLNSGEIEWQRPIGGLRTSGKGDPQYRVRIPKNGRPSLPQWIDLRWMPGRFCSSLVLRMDHCLGSRSRRSHGRIPAVYEVDGRQYLLFLSFPPRRA